MEPRLKSSLRWTELPVELKNHVLETFEAHFEDFELPGEFTVQGWIYPEEIVVQVGMTELGRLRQNNFQMSADYNPNDENAVIKWVHLAADFLGAIWEEFLEDEADPLDYPIDWIENEFEKSIVFARYTSHNTSLEEQANELLGMEANLTQGDWDSDPNALH